MIVIEPYNLQWPSMFAAECERIKRALGDMLVTVEHIGSTAVPGLAAKPIIDILPAIGEHVELDMTVAPMIRAGYIYIHQYEDTFPERRLYKRHSEASDDSDVVTLPAVNIHLVKMDSAFYQRHVAFRDIMRGDDAIRDAYQSLKLELAPKFDVVNDYAYAKTEFIDAIMLKHGIKRS